MVMYAKYVLKLPQQYLKEVGYGTLLKYGIINTILYAYRYVEIGVSGSGS